MTVKPLGDRVLLKQLEAETKSAGGIILSTSAKEEPQLAKVIAVGPGKVVDGKMTEMQVKVGDTVFYGKYVGTEIKVDGEKYLLMSESDILAIAE